MRIKRTLRVLALAGGGGLPTKEMSDAAGSKDQSEEAQEVVPAQLEATLAAGTSALKVALEQAECFRAREAQLVDQGEAHRTLREAMPEVHQLLPLAARLEAHEGLRGRFARGVCANTEEHHVRAHQDLGGTSSRR